MRLAEKGYSVLVLERGKRFRDQDFAKTNWRVWKYRWLPPLRCFGILQITAFRNVLVLHGCGSAEPGYANVLMEPDDRLFDATACGVLSDWKTILKPHYDFRSGCSASPCYPKLGLPITLWKGIACEWGAARLSDRPTARRPLRPRGRACSLPALRRSRAYPHRLPTLGGCMVGCRDNAKNTTVKNYLDFAEKRVLPGSRRVRGDRHPSAAGLPGTDGTRYEVIIAGLPRWTAGRSGARARKCAKSPLELSAR